MPNRQPSEIHVYHITDLSNLAGIIQCGGVHCDRAVRTQQIRHNTIGHLPLKERRLEIKVNTNSNGNLAEYVPFYFTTRSPMLYAIHKNNVQGYQSGQGNIIYLTGNFDQISRSSLDWCFTDGHGVEGITNFFTSTNDLDKIDWTAIRASYWVNTSADPDRKRRKQAEFLVKRHFPLEMVKCIGVIDEERKVQVERLVSGLTPQIPVVVHPDWYY